MRPDCLLHVGAASYALGLPSMHWDHLTRIGTTYHVLGLSQSRPDHLPPAITHTVISYLYYKIIT